MKYQSSNGSRKVLEGKAKELRQIGMGKKNTSNALDVSEEEILWGKGEPGDGSPLSLVRTLWFLCTQHFRVEGCQEHFTMQVEDLVFLRQNGIDYIKFLYQIFGGSYTNLQKCFWLEDQNA